MDYLALETETGGPMELTVEPADSAVRPPARRRQRLLLDALLLFAGMAISLVVTAATLQTARANLQVERDLVVMLAVLFLPLGVTLVTSLRICIAESWRERSLGEWLLPATFVIELAWCEVWLDAGIYLGAWGKFVGGPTALLGTPLLAAIAAAILLWSLATSRRGTYRWTHWLGIAMAIIAFVGCAWSVIVLMSALNPKA